MSPQLREREGLMRILLVVFAVGAVAGCDVNAGDRHPVRSVGFTAAESSYYLSSTEGCEFLARRLNPDPTRLVTEYVRRDGQGEFLHTNRWLDSAYDCPGHLPGPDEFTVVRDSRVTDARTSDTVASVLVRSQVLGVMTQDSAGPLFRPQARLKTDTFVVVLTPYGWRIREPQLPDNVLASWVLAAPQLARLRSSSRDAMQQALRAQ